MMNLSNVSTFSNFNAAIRDDRAFVEAIDPASHRPAAMQSGRVSRQRELDSIEISHQLDASTPKLRNHLDKSSTKIANQNPQNVATSSTHSSDVTNSSSAESLDEVTFTVTTVEGDPDQPTTSTRPASHAEPAVGDQRNDAAYLKVGDFSAITSAQVDVGDQRNDAAYIKIDGVYDQSGSRRNGYEEIKWTIDATG